MASNNAAMASAALTNQPFAAGIILATLSFITMLVIMPPLFWHIRNNNIGATALVSWLVLLLLVNFVNALLWPSDDFATWYNGAGLCDVEVKLQVAAQVALPASFACILRALAAVMDTDKSTLTQTRAQRRRSYAIDLLWCLGFPLLQMLFHYLVQPHRYYIFGISGCVAAVNNSWLTIVLIIVPPAIWVVVDTYYAVLILTRLYRYRLTFRTILASSNTTTSRFLRLYLICILWTLCGIPLETYIFYDNGLRQWHAYSWDDTHAAAAWEQLIFVKSDGNVFFDRWIPVGFGVGVFIFFGFGKEAVAMYGACVRAVGLGGVLDWCARWCVGRKGEGKSLRKRMMMMVARRQGTKDSATLTTDTNTSQTLVSEASYPPKKAGFADSTDGPNNMVRSSPQTLPVAGNRSISSRFFGLLGRRQAQPRAGSKAISLHEFKGYPPTGTVCSDCSSETAIRDST